MSNRTKWMSAVISMIRACVVGGLAGLAVNSAYANNPPTVTSTGSLTSYRSLVSSITHHQVHVIKTVPTGVPDLTALVTSDPNGQKELVFGIDGKYLITGAIIGDHHVILNKVIAEQQGLIQKPMAVDLLTEKAMTSNGFILGHSGPMLTAFLDPNCIFCHVFYTDVLPELNAGKLRIKVVPVGFLKPSSLPKAVSIMESKNPAKSWAANEAHFNVNTEEGGALPSNNVHTPVAAEIHANTQLLSRTGGVATPTILYCTKTGHPAMVQGAEPAILNAIRSGDIGSLSDNGKCHEQ